RNSKVLKDIEEEDNKGMVETKPSQDELDQGKPSLGDPSQDKPAQEELPQVSVVHRASGAVEEAENKPEEIGGEEASQGSSGPMNNRNRDGNAQQQPPQEAVMPEGSRMLHAGAMMIVHYHRPRFTHSQLQDLENFFQVNPFPSLLTR
ncbi:rhox homeobox family member 2-like, partial [Sigmodon hispidus]